MGLLDALFGTSGDGSSKGSDGKGSDNDHIISKEPGLWTTVTPSNEVPGGYIVSTGDTYRDGRPVAAGPDHHATHVLNADGTSADVKANDQWKDANSLKQSQK